MRKREREKKSITTTRKVYLRFAPSFTRLTKGEENNQQNLIASIYYGIYTMNERN